MDRITAAEDPAEVRRVSIRLSDGREIPLGPVLGRGAIVITQTLDLADAGSESRQSWHAYARAHMDPALWDNRPA